MYGPLPWQIRGPILLPGPAPGRLAHPARPAPAATSTWTWLSARPAIPARTGPAPPCWPPSATRGPQRTAHPPGTRLPSSRALAADLGLARNTVAAAYAELVAEGWLSARQGSGTRVAERAEPLPPGRPRTPPRTDGAESGVLSRYRRWAERPRHDLRTGAPDVSAFPRPAWLASARRALTARARGRLLAHGDPRGTAELRRALAGYLARSRGVRAAPERIVVCAGFGQGLALLARAVPGEPGRRGVRAALPPRTAGIRPGPHPSAAGGRARRPHPAAGLRSALRRRPRRAAHPRAPVPGRRPAASRPQGGGRGLGRADRRAGAGGRLRRRVPVRQGARGGFAGARPRPGRPPGHRQQGPGAGSAAGLDGAARPPRGGGAGGEDTRGVDHRRPRPAHARRLPGKRRLRTAMYAPCGSATAHAATGSSADWPPASPRCAPPVSPRACTPSSGCRRARRRRTPCARCTAPGSPSTRCPPSGTRRPPPSRRRIRPWWSATAPRPNTPAPPRWTPCAGRWRARCHSGGRL